MVTTQEKQKVSELELLMLDENIEIKNETQKE